MRDRLLTLALALGALLAFYTLLAPQPAPPQEQVTRPLGTEPGPNGYLALQRWLASASIETLSLRERYSRLTELTAAPGGNLLITTAPHVYAIRNSELGALGAWLDAGNTLLLVAGLSDTPEWSIGTGQDRQLLEHMTLMTGLRFIAVQPPAVPPAPAGTATQGQDAAPSAAPAGTANPPAALERLPEPLHSTLRPSGSHPLLEGVDAVAAVSEFPSARWNAVADGRLLLQLTHDEASGTPALWLMRHGEGQIILSAYGSIFTNKMLGKVDNARLLGNITRWALGPGGRVILDDAHQGLVAFYDPAKFFGDARLHHSLWWLFGLWVVFVVGARPFRAAISSWQPVDVMGFVQATAGFLARVSRPAASGQRLLENFFNEIRSRLGLPVSGAPLWDWLEAHPALPAGEVARLRELARKAQRRERLDLVELHNALSRLRARLG